MRSTSAKDKVAHLTALGEALPGKLTLHEADLLKVMVLTLFQFLFAFHFYVL